MKFFILSLCALNLFFILNCSASTPQRETTVQSTYQLKIKDETWTLHYAYQSHFWVLQKNIEKECRQWIHREITPIDLENSHTDINGRLLENSNNLLVFENINHIGFVPKSKGANCEEKYRQRIKITGVFDYEKLVADIRSDIFTPASSYFDEPVSDHDWELAADFFIYPGHSKIEPLISGRDPNISTVGIAVYKNVITEIQNDTRYPFFPDTHHVNYISSTQHFGPIFYPLSTTDRYNQNYLMVVKGKSMNLDVRADSKNRRDYYLKSIRQLTRLNLGAQSK